jgi:acetyl-CoA synthetase
MDLALSYAEACARFSWAASLEALGWRADGSVNLADTIAGRHDGPVALRSFGKDGHARALGFRELSDLVGRVGSFLASRRISKGDRIAGFLPRVPETLAIMLATWKIGAVYVPIFTGFGHDAVAFRVRHSGARMLFTHHAYRDRVPPLPDGTTVVTLAGDASGAAADIPFESVTRMSPNDAPGVASRRDDPAVVLYTSGSTGPPKGVLIASNFLLSVYPWITLGVDLRRDDVFWPTGDPGWGYGLICYMAALALGVPVVSQEATPTAEQALERIAGAGITNLATTPTLLRAIMALGRERVRAYPAALRRVSSCGEPLNAEVVSFFREVWNVTVMDHYGSSEFGLPIGNLAATDMPVKPGSMGRPLPGSRAAVVDDRGREVAPGVVGQIALAPSEVGYYALGYWNDEERTRDVFRRDWITIGDLGRRDEAGYFWFEGRADDVIKSAGYRIGPFDVESVILEHPAVAEAAVVGVPDDLRGQAVKAFVVLRAGLTPSPSTASEIVDLVKRKVGHHQYPRAVEFVGALPKTETGKIQRFMLRTQ